MTAAVVMPFWGNDPLRVRNHDLVVEALNELPSEWTGIQPIADSLAKARNLGAKLTTDPVLVFCDADTVCPPAQIIEAVALAAAKPGMVFCFDRYIRLTRAATGRLRNWTGCAGADVESVFEEPPSHGCMAISRTAFEEIGGYHEGFVGWGFEDMDFTSRAEKLWDARRVSGPVYHLWHGERRDDDTPLDAPLDVIAANRRLYEERGGRW